MVLVVECHEFGPLERLRVTERPAAPLPDGHVRVEVSACGVNHVDGLFVQGRYQIKPPLPFVPGMEAVGRVVELGAGVDPSQGHPELGSRVLANVGLGGYASEVIVQADRVTSLPDTLSDGQAATFMQSYLTGWYALRERGAVAAGDTMLVLGAGGGVGLAAVDIGAALGLRVVAAASTDDKRRLALERGAEVVLDTSAGSPDDVKSGAKDFATSAGRDTTRRDGVDHLYDPVGGDWGETCLRALGENGQYLVIGFVAGIPKLPANQVLLRNRRITGVDWGAWAARHPDENQRLLSEVLEMVAEGRLSPVEPVTYPLEEAAAALAALEARQVPGKVALIP
jgi:NADPH:quinone reductase